ncbi:peptidase M28 [Hymenobacter sp. UV11]|nr:peptidase M28 [Hymenobacter sp. UV11]
MKTKSKPGKTAAALAPATDFSLRYASGITAEDLRKHLSILASDEYEGRETGKKGQKMAAEYISKQFTALGLTGPVKDSDSPYLQHFTMNRLRLDPSTSVKIGGKTFVLNKDFYAVVNGTFVTATPVQPVFAGYGIQAEGYTDFAAAGDLHGKDLLMLLGEPMGKNGKPLRQDEKTGLMFGDLGFQGVVDRMVAIRPLKPRSLFCIEPTAGAFGQVPKTFAYLLGLEQLAFADAPARTRPNLFIVSPEMGSALLGTNAAGLANYQKAVAAAGKPVVSPFKPAAALVQTVEKKEPFTTENVLGFLEGSDKKEEVIVVSAHYDHLGVKDGKVFNGADDDGSGTVSVLELAEAFAQAKKDGHGPRRSILFLANTGEEEGALGSEYYTSHPIFPLENTVTDLNIDMVGRVDSTHRGKGDYLYLVGSDKLSSELHALSEATNQKYNPVALDYKFNDPNDPERIYFRSDHYNFAKHQVPVIFYYSGGHPQFHQPTDDVDLIDFPAMVRRDQLIFHTAWELANRDSRVVVDSNKP